MLGLIKKDFSIIRANLKSVIIIFVVYLVMAFQGNLDMSFIVPLIGLMLFISTFSYDDFNNFNAFVSTLPNGRKNAVKAKYIASIILIIILAVISLGVTILINYVRTNTFNISEIIMGLMGTLLSCIIIISLLYPIILKFGSTNGRIILFSVVFGISAIIGIIARFVDMTFLINIVNSIDDIAFIVIPIISIVLLLISYIISYKIYINKEF